MRSQNLCTTYVGNGNTGVQANSPVTVELPEILPSTFKGANGNLFRSIYEQIKAHFASYLSNSSSSSANPPKVPIVRPKNQVAATLQMLQQKQ